MKIDKYFIQDFAVYSFFALTGLSLAAIIGWIIFSDKITLIKSEWKCTSSHIEESITMINAGNNVNVPVFQQHKICDRYEKSKTTTTSAHR